MVGFLPIYLCYLVILVWYFCRIVVDIVDVYKALTTEGGQVHTCVKEVVSLWIHSRILHYYQLCHLWFFCRHSRHDHVCLSFVSSAPGCFCTEERDSVPHQICQVLVQSVRTVEISVACYTAWSIDELNLGVAGEFLNACSLYFWWHDVKSRANESPGCGRCCFCTDWQTKTALILVLKTFS